jgi:phosphocarrier protein
MEPSSERDYPPAHMPEGTLVRELPIVNRKGLHARASAKFVQTVERYDSDVTVTRCGETVGGRSIMGLLTLGAAQGTTITVTAQGEDAEACLQGIADLLANRFGEDE